MHLEMLSVSKILVFQNTQNFIEMTSNMIYIVALGVALKCLHKMHLNTQCPPPSLQYIIMGSNSYFFSVLLEVGIWIYKTCHMTFHFTCYMTCHKTCQMTFHMTSTCHIPCQMTCHMTCHMTSQMTCLMNCLKKLFKTTNQRVCKKES